MGVWSTGFGNGYETSDVEEIFEFCLETYHELTLPPTDEDGIPLDTSTISDAALPLIIGIDGRSGSGKTRLSELLEQSLSTEGIGVRVLNLDSIYPGWDGLEEGTKAWQKISRNLREGKPANYREWDWHADAPGTEHTINPAQETVIICEGVGAITGTCDVRIVVKAPDELRYRRAIDRDGETYRPHWERWAAQEEALFATYSAKYAQADFIYRTA
ncbi:hypothetical protein [Rothia dentocariosa]|uniref:hypothetical protein n=1 Tax=Rothia dentocariosa TaxID=2047 RepID=UPI00211D614A|nr:hypothetical protein [Rothia dentocariosa]